MRKIYILVIIFFSLQKVNAQLASHVCSEAKTKTLLQTKKKTRANDAANALMSKYDVHFYYLDIAAERNNTNLSGFTTIGAIVQSPTLDTFCFELNSTLIIDSIMYNNQSISYVRNASISNAILPSPASQNANISVQIYYHGDASITGASAIGDGYNKGTSGSWGNSVTWSLSQPYSAYEWFPCKQFLQDKADSAWIFVTTSNQNKVGSNGLLEGIDSLPNSKVKYRWKTNYMIDYYLISIAIARYVEYTTYAHLSSLPNDSIPIVNYVYDNPNTLPFVKPYLDSMGILIEFFSDKLGVYPFYKEKYGHCMAPFSGGMEHQTMSSVGFLQSFSLNVHELVHQWFGDYVTCKTWKDIFINEGFASYGEYMGLEQFHGYAAAQSNMQDVHDNILIDNNARVYFTDTTNVNRIFDSRLTYDKGGAVIHTLHFILGDSLFYSGLRNFLSQYAFSSASIDDLHTSLQSHTGVNLDDYFNQWLYGAGSPNFFGQYYSTGSNIILKVNHTTTSPATTLFKTPLELKCLSASGDTIVKVSIDQNSNTFVFPSSKIITGVQVDPNNWLINLAGTFSINQALSNSTIDDINFGNQISIYPNPSSDFVEITSTQNENIQYIVTDVRGKKVAHGNFQEKVKLNLSGFSSGIYFVELFSENSRVVRKFIKQ